jgi:hypothetical protein
LASIFTIKVARKNKPSHNLDYQCLPLVAGFFMRW